MNAQREQQHRQQKFDAALQGVDLDEPAQGAAPAPQDEGIVTVEQVKARAMARLGASEKDSAAIEFGFDDPSLGHDYDIMR